MVRWREAPGVSRQMIHNCRQQSVWKCCQAAAAAIASGYCVCTYVADLLTTKSLKLLICLSWNEVPSALYVLSVKVCLLSYSMWKHLIFFQLWNVVWSDYFYFSFNIPDVSVTVNYWRDKWHNLNCVPLVWETFYKFFF